MRLFHSYSYLLWSTCINSIQSKSRIKKLIYLFWSIKTKKLVLFIVDESRIQICLYLQHTNNVFLQFNVWFLPISVLRKSAALEGRLDTYVVRMRIYFFYCLAIIAIWRKEKVNWKGQRKRILRGKRLMLFRAINKPGKLLHVLAGF